MEGYQMEDQKVIVMNHSKQFVYGLNFIGDFVYILFLF